MKNFLFFFVLCEIRDYILRCVGEKWWRARVWWVVQVLKECGHGGRRCGSGSSTFVAVRADPN
jgi:hypothetical protein